MKKEDIPEMITPEIIEALAVNVDALKELLRVEEERRKKEKEDRKKKDAKKCCCPEFLKFKFVICNVKLFNDNVECPSHG